MKVVIYPYKIGSGSAKELATRLNTRRVHADRAYRGYRNHVAINWGNSVVPRWAGNVHEILNHPDVVARTTNKLHYFEHMGKECPELIPEFATTKEGARELFNKGKVVVARTVLTGHSGNGIVVCREEDELPDARLYTLHCRHADEYRIHVFKGQVLSIQQKKRRSQVEEVDTFVRNVDNGWVFCRENVEAPQAVLDCAVLTTSVCGLDFGAVDIAYRVKDDKAFALEVNTAPNVVNTTAEHYVKAISDYVSSL